MNPSPSYRGPRAGFTLVELLVCIGIIAVLAAMLLSGVNSAKQKSQALLCTARLRNIGAAFFSYANDNDGTLPIIDYVTAGSSLQKNTFWANMIMPYLGITNLNDNQLKCPTIAAKRGNSSASSPWSYSMNNGLADLALPSSGGSAAKVGRRTVALPTPTTAVMLFCSPRAWTSVARQNDIASGGPGPGYGNIISPQSASSFFGQVHQGKANVLFADGHVAPCAFLDINSSNYWGN